jgi:hydroxymethylpyrimidine pyrophosphatase-like HAD family hydrolase
MTAVQQTESRVRKIVLNESVEEQLWQFLRQSAYPSHGGIVTDLDGTVVHEEQGRIHIPKPVEFALKELYDLGRPLILNTLRFPLSVIRTFGKDWYSISNSPIPTVTLNGSQLGFVTKTAQGELTFEEITAFTLTSAEIDEVLEGVKGLLEGGIDDILVFYYPRDWRMGEIIWTPVPEKVQPVKEKYLSASAVTAVEFAKLRDQMLAEELCMVFLLVNVPQDKLMAYQHTKRGNFFTRQGVDKLYGAQSIAAKLNIDLQHSLGAGDTEMDNFLKGVGLAVIVGRRNLDFRGSLQTIKLKNSFELGDLLFRLAEIQRELRA